MISTVPFHSKLSPISKTLIAFPSFWLCETLQMTQANTVSWRIFPLLAT